MPTKNVNGERIEMTPEEIAELEAAQQEYPSTEQIIRNNSAVLAEARRVERLAVAEALVETMESGPQKEALTVILSELKGE